MLLFLPKYHYRKTRDPIVVRLAITCNVYCLVRMNRLLACFLILLLEARHAVTLAIPSSKQPQSSSTPHSSSWVSSLSARATTTNQQEKQQLNDNSNNDPDDHGELPADLPRRPEALKALAAVRRACEITAALQPIDTNAFESAVQKNDSSPVTVADFAVQASVLHALRAEFPEAGFIAEEDSSALRTERGRGRKQRRAVALQRACAHTRILLL